MADGSIAFFASTVMEDELQDALDNALTEALDPANVGPVNLRVSPTTYMPTPFMTLMPGEGLHAEVGETKIYEVTNFTRGDHTFHTHGFTFQPLEIISVNLEKDTPAERVVVTPIPLRDEDSFIIPRRPDRGSRTWTILRAAVRFDDTNKPPFLRRTDEEMTASGLLPSAGPLQDPENDTSGGWLVHCHFLEHASSGMGTLLNLVIPD